MADLRSHGYFYYSLLLCCYSAMFATTVFFVPYYVELGYSNSRIGIIMAANSAMASVFPPLLGLLSDKLRSKRKTLLFCLAVLGLTALCVPVVGKQFLLTLLIAALYNGLRYATVSIGETWAMSEVNRAAALGSRLELRLGAGMGIARLFPHLPRLLFLPQRHRRLQRHHHVWRRRTGSDRLLHRLRRQEQGAGRGSLPIPAPSP